MLDAGGFFGDQLAKTFAQLALRKTDEFVSDDYKVEKIVVQKLSCMDDIIDSVERLVIAKFCSSVSEKLLAAGFFET